MRLRYYVIGVIGILVVWIKNKIYSIFINMNVEIEIYVRKLREFFNTDEQARKDMFSGYNVNLDEFFKVVKKQAEVNVGLHGEPTLTAKQMMDIMMMLTIGEQIIDDKVNKNVKKVFKKLLDDMPPFCMN